MRTSISRLKMLTGPAFSGSDGEIIQVGSARGMPAGIVSKGCRDDDTAVCIVVPVAHPLAGWLSLRGVKGCRARMERPEWRRLPPCNKGEHTRDLGLTALILLGLYAGWKLTYPTYSYRYRLAVDVLVDGAIGSRTRRQGWRSSVRWLSVVAFWRFQVNRNSASKTATDVGGRWPLPYTSSASMQQARRHNLRRPARSYQRRETGSGSR
jgi:hypothetical protein